jgi:hypothetical protein
VRWAILLFIATILLLATLLPIGIAETPLDERVEIDLYLAVSNLEMPVGTQDVTTAMVQGWVVMSKKPPGESVPVEFLVTPQDHYVSGTANPSVLAFHREGTLYFNLSILMIEDTPPGVGHRIDVNARANSKIGTDGDAAVLIVTGIAQFDGQAEMKKQPKKVRPGGTAKGVVQVTNTGTQYCEYYLELMVDQGAVVESVEFDIKVELTPNWVEKAPFSIDVPDAHLPGQYSTTIGLMARLQDGSTFRVDTFEVFIEVTEPEDEGGAGPWLVAIVVVFALVAVFVAVAVRRKA